MRIGELAKQTGLTASRIRFYESAGLINTVARQANGYRSYPPEAASVLGIIDSAQRAGFSLEQIRSLLPSGDGSWKHDELLQALKAKVGEIDRLLTQLRENRMQLLAAIEGIENKPDGMSCTANAQRMLHELRDDDSAKPRRRGNRRKS